MCLCSQLCIMRYLWPELLRTPPPPSGVAIDVISVDATSLWNASSTRAAVWVNVQGWGGGKECFEGEAMGLMVLHGWRG